MRPGIMCGLLAASLLCHGAARADDAARQHFESGKRLRDEGDCTRALVEFDRSVASERSIGALYNLGFCHEQLGHRQEAYDAYRGARELASQKRDGRLREISGALAGLLETPHIRLVLPQPLPDGLQVRVDGELVPAATYAVETVIFTRSNKYHLVIVTAPGLEERRLTVETKQVAPVELKKAEPKAEPAVSAAPPEPEPAREKTGWSTQRKVGIGVLAGGVLTAGAAAYLYARHRSEIGHIDTRLNNALADCKPTEDPAGCEKQPRSSHNDEITRANRRAYIFVGGTSAIALGLLVTGTVLFATGSTTTSTTAWTFAPFLTAGSRGAVLSGAF